MKDIYKTRKKDEINTADNLNNIYTNLINQIKDKQRQHYQNNSLNDKAKTIENFLKAIKQYQQLFQQQLQENPKKNPKDIMK